MNIYVGNLSYEITEEDLAVAEESTDLQEVDVEATAAIKHLNSAG